MTRQVFISHSAADRDAADAIRSALEAQHLSCWIAPRDIPPGAEWAAAIMAGIAEVRVVVLVHSAACSTSPMVLREVNVAVDSRTPVIPVRIDATPPQAGMQFYLGSTHWLDASTGPLPEQLPRIVEAVADQLGSDHGPTHPDAPAPPAPALPDKPSPVVLSFQTIGNDTSSGTGRTPYVGRSEERSLLRQAMDRATAGAGGVALIAGEAGLGKTRLVDEIAAEARARGMFVVRGHCYDMEGAPPYVPFVEAIEYGLTVTSRYAFRAAMGDAGPEIARFVPKVHLAFPDLPPPLALPTDQARHYMFESVCDFFERAAAIQPMLMALEDLHWADESTTQLLERVARRAGPAALL